ncbi:MAG TPA: hypothetical protein VK427_08520 [Kofleriaceae bacterium]|nr:hypothetical protein [Kofleriaceae bacterium]
MITRLVAVTLLVASVLEAPAMAGPRKVLVLPLDGSAPADTRTKLSASFQKMARVLDGRVEAGNTSLGDTATAIGCDPAQLACIEDVRTTLGVDELVYGTADEDAGTVTVVAKRYRKGKPVRALTVSQAAAEPASKIEPALLPVFGEEPLPVDASEPVTRQPQVTGTEPVMPLVARSSHRERNIWIGVTGGGGLILLLGLALWQQAGDLQDDIDGARIDDRRDLDALRQIEDKASSRAWAGNLCVLAGLAVGGYGGYRMWKALGAKQVVVTPTPVDGGAAVTLTFVGAGW